MKTIIAGSPGIDTFDLLEKIMGQYKKLQPTEVVVGFNDDVSKLARQWAMLKGIPVTEIDIEDSSFSGPLHNMHMADYSDVLVALWDGVSLELAHLIASAYSKGKQVLVFIVTKKEHALAN